MRFSGELYEVRHPEPFMGKGSSQGSDSFGFYRLRLQNDMRFSGELYEVCHPETRKGMDPVKFYFAFSVSSATSCNRPFVAMLVKPS